VGPLIGGRESRKGLRVSQGGMDQDQIDARSEPAPRGQSGGRPWWGVAELARELYTRLPVTDCSRRALESPHATLAVLPGKGVGWNDLGMPERVRPVRREVLAVGA